MLKLCLTDSLTYKSVLWAALLVVCRILSCDVRQESSIGDTVCTCTAPEPQHGKPYACLPVSRRPGFPPSWGNGGRAGLELVAHRAVEVGEIVLCPWNCSPIMTCDLCCKSLCQCQSVQLNRWGLLILKQGKGWYYTDLIISLNLQPRLLDRPKDWNVKEMIFWCDLLCNEESLVQEE